MTNPVPKHLVFFDGNCGFCDHTVQWLLARDSKEQLYFAPLEGDMAGHVLSHFVLPEGLDSIIYVRTLNDVSEMFVYSDAIGQILKELPWYWSWLRVGWLTPRGIRDQIYKAFAARRIQWFGTVDACQLPNERQSRRLLS
jgi:predicted DCC family thiol-disulfide oxidoreductase YuxK